MPSFSESKNMADKTEKAVDLGILEEDDEFEEFPAEDWKENTDTDPKNVSSTVNFLSKLEFLSTSRHINFLSDL